MIKKSPNELVSCADDENIPFKLLAITLPSTFNEPVNECISSPLSPNFVLPLWNTIDEETYSVWNSCAVILSVTTKEPVIVKLPLILSPLAFT